MHTFIDIETIPQQPEEAGLAEAAKRVKAPATMSKPETIEQWHNGEGKYAGIKDAMIEKEYRKTSFDGSKGEIFSIAFALEDGDVNVVRRHDLLPDSEMRMLKCVFEVLETKLYGRPPYFIGQYIAGFDLKFIFHRCVVLGIKPPFAIPFDGRHGKDYYCTQQAWAGFGGRISQDNLCKALGIEGKPQDIDGSKVWDFVKAGKYAEVAEYNQDDVEKNRQIFNRLNFKG